MMNIIKTVKTTCCICGSNKYSVITTGKDYEYSTCENTFKIVKCNNCRHVYLNPKPKLGDFKIIYPDNYYAYDFLNKEKFALANIGKRIIEKRYIKLYRSLIGKKGRILEVGCGDGRLLALLKTAGYEWNLNGLDFNAGGNKIAEEKGLMIYNGKFEDVDLPKESFNLVIMNEVLEHLDNPAKSLKKVREILKPGGYFVIETPCLGSWDYKLFNKSYWGGYHIPRHFNIFSKESIKRLLEKNGFRFIEKISLPSPPFWILSIHNLLYDKGWNKNIVKFFNFYNPFLLMVFTMVDLIQMTLGITSTMRIIAEKENL